MKMGALVADPRKYVDKILESYEKMFGEKPKKAKTPLVAGDHPETGLSEFYDQDHIKQYQTIVWTVNLAHWTGENQHWC